MFGKYDDYDYHVAAAIEAGFEPDNAFTHIGFMVSWLIRHGLFRTEFIGPEAGVDLASGKLRPNDLRDLVDGKLVDEMLTPVGSTFLANYYERYLTQFVEAFPGVPDYGVSDDPANQAIVDGLIDEAFIQWRALGQPQAPAREPSLPEDLPADLPTGSMVFEYGGPPELLDGIELPPGIEVKLVDHHRHHDPVLEKLIADAIPVPLDLDTSTASGWGTSLRRQLRELGVKPKDVVIASGLARDAHPDVTVVRVPGVDRARIFEAFREDRSYGPKLDWQPCDIAGRPGLTCTQQLPGLPLSRGIWFAMDGYSVDISSRANDARLFEFAESLARALAAG